MADTESNVPGAFCGWKVPHNLLVLRPAYHGYFDIFSDADSLVLWKVLYDRGSDPTDEVAGSRRIFYRPDDTLSLEVVGIKTVQVDDGDIILKRYKITVERHDAPWKGEYHSGWTMDTPQTLPGMCIESLQKLPGGLDSLYMSPARCL